MIIVIVITGLQTKQISLAPNDGVLRSQLAVFEIELILEDFLRVVFAF